MVPKPKRSSAASGEKLEAQLRAQLVEMAEELATAPALLVGDRVTLRKQVRRDTRYKPVRRDSRADDDEDAMVWVSGSSAALLQGHAGIVVCPSAFDMHAKIPSKVWQFRSSSLRRREECRSSAQAQEILARLIKPPVADSITLKPCSLTSGHTLGKVMRALRARMLVVSTTQNGPKRAGLPPYDEVPVMSGLERLAGYVFPNLVTAYDFNGSSSAELRQKEPDVRWGGVGSTPMERIPETQWFSYWSGGVRTAAKAMLLSAEPLESVVRIADCKGQVTGAIFNKGSRHVFAISVSGGPVTQTEKTALPGLLRGVIADLSTRDLDIKDTYIHWLHFETLDEYLMALQGYGGIDLGGLMDSRAMFGLPGEWIFCERNAEYDLLTDVPGGTLDERRAFLMTVAAPDRDTLVAQMNKAILCESTERVRELLGLAVDNTPLPQRECPPLCVDPNWRMHDGLSMFMFAASRFNLEAMEALLAAGARPHAVDTNGVCALAFAVGRWYDLKKAMELPKVEGAAQRMILTIERCAQAQLGTSYWAHRRALKVGAAVTWTNKTNEASEAGDFAGTIMTHDPHDEDVPFEVEGATSRIRVWFNPAMLRLASAEKSMPVTKQR